MTMGFADEVTMMDYVVAHPQTILGAVTFNGKVNDYLLRTNTSAYGAGNMSIYYASGFLTIQQALDQVLASLCLHNVRGNTPAKHGRCADNIWGFTSLRSNRLFFVLVTCTSALNDYTLTFFV